MKTLFRRLGKFLVVAALLAVGAVASIAQANHAWGGYHWARTANPFVLKLGDNVSGQWDIHLTSSSVDWTVSTVLDTAVVAGMTNPKVCKAVTGRVEVCNSKYGNNGWLGIASIWASGSHITKGTVKLNDTYFNTAKYNTSAWRQFVMCQEIGHTFGLDHQDEAFDNLNMGTCMDYTNDPSRDDGAGNNLTPNAHDYEELELIYTHLDAITTALSSAFSNKSLALAMAGDGETESSDDVDTSNPSEWGKIVRKYSDGRSSVHEKDLGNGKKLFTFVIWAE